MGDRRFIHLCIGAHKTTVTVTVIAVGEFRSPPCIHSSFRMCNNSRHVERPSSITPIVGVQIIKVISPPRLSRKTSQCICFVIGSLCLRCISTASLLIRLLLSLLRLIRHLLRILRKIDEAIYLLVVFHFAPTPKGVQGARDGEIRFVQTKKTLICPCIWQHKV